MTLVEQITQDLCESGESFYEVTIPYSKFKNLNIPWQVHRQIDTVKRRKVAYLSYERNPHDKDDDIYVLELEIKRLGIFQGFPKPNKQEIVRWKNRRAVQSRKENAWVTRNAPKKSSANITQLLRMSRL